MKPAKKIFMAALSAMLLFAVLNGCKKYKADDVKSHEADIEAIKAKLKNEPVGAKYQLNLPGKGYYGDINGNKIIPGSIKRSEYFCPGDPSEDELSQEILSSFNEFTCGQGFKVTVTYEVKVWYNLEYDNPNNSSQISKGRLKLYNSSSQVIWSNTAIPIANIVLTGTEPYPGGGLPDYNVYEITFTTGYIDETTFNSSSNAQASLCMYTDCDDVATVNIGYSAQQIVPTTGNYTVPCSRVDKVWFVPNPGGSAASALGVIAVSTCSIYGYVYPDQQQIEIDLGNPAGYQPIRLWKYNPIYYPGGPYPQFIYNNSGIIDNTDVWYIEMTGYDNGSGGTANISAGTYPIRYKNKQLSTYGGPCTSGSWVTENWYIN